MSPKLTTGFWFQGTCSRCGRKQIPVTKVKALQICGRCVDEAGKKH